jgi:two-component system phosphate regulon response regulator OmpR
MDRARPPHLVVVEDDPALRDMVCSYLAQQHFDVTGLDSAEALLQRMQRTRPDLVILDVGLPRMSGLDACVKLRAEGDRVPIILLTARCEEIDRVLGLEMGADDYLSKPFSARELLARARAVMRRTAFTPIAAPDSDEAVRIGDFVFVMAERCLRRGEEVRVLSTIECALLTELASHPGTTLSRERLLAASHAPGDDISLRAVDAAMVRLRRTIEPDPAMPRYLQTVRGHGYVFVPRSTHALA